MQYANHKPDANKNTNHHRAQRYRTYKLITVNYPLHYTLLYRVGLYSFLDFLYISHWACIGNPSFLYMSSSSNILFVDSLIKTITLPFMYLPPTIFS